jgi:S-DNA-T family DNA segregation ATPase FtsK/SpoIIIE
MTQTTNNTGRTSVFPEGTGDFVRRRAFELVGLALLVAAIAFALALLSFAPEDPSLNSATTRHASNVLGLPGAYVADFTLQTLGCASSVLLPILAAWAWRLVADRSADGMAVRLALCPAVLTAAAVGLAGIPAPASWPIAVGLGGVVGDMILGALDGLRAGHVPGLPASIIPTAFALLAAGLLVPTLGLSRHEWRGLGRGFGRGLGAGSAAAGRLAGRAARLARKADTASPARVRDGLTDRREPTLGNAPHASDETAPQAPEARAAVEVDEPLVPRRVAQRLSRPKVGKRVEEERQPALDLVPSDNYQLPPLSLLAEPKAVRTTTKVSAHALEQNARMLESVLEEFGVRGQITEVRPGPVVTLYELEPAPGTKTSRVIGLADDIARSMSAVSARIAVVPGKNAIGIELPNGDRETVYLRELLASAAYENTAANLTLALGKDIAGAPVIVDLARMPHLLVAGTTGSGKSVGINSMILSLLYRLPPDQCKLILIDPKMLELSVYDDIPNLLTPVVTEPGKAVIALKWTVREMENRYRAMSQLGVRNIGGYNQRLAEVMAKGETLSRTVQTGFDPESGEPVYEEQAINLDPFPYIVVVVDEMADLMLVAGKDIEGAIRRLSQMARAAGIHLIMATQRPSVDVITGTIKANFPSRISFQVTSRIDSRTILDEQGAEQLLGAGDMLYQASGGRVQRVHGPFVSDGEVERVVSYLKKQGAPQYLKDVTEDVDASFDGGGGGENGEGDELYNQAVALVMRERRASTSFIQRHLQIGYNRAARMMEQMEADGVVTPADRSGKRDVVLPDGGGFD